MKLRWAALAAVLALSALSPRLVAGQGMSTGGGQRGSALGQNYPNPFNPTTTIPFKVGDPENCSDRSRLYRVTLRIYNVLAQLVAVPILQGTTNAAGQPVENVSLSCGEYTAYWNGTYLRSNRQVASGVYLYRIEIDGRPEVKKMIVMK